jgi:hypothetical protein
LGLSDVISARYGGQCAIKDPGCYLCLTAYDPAAGCAQCASGFKLATKPLKGRRAALANSFTVPYCVGSVLLGAAENEVVTTVGPLQPAINTASDAKLNALRNIATQLNSTLSNAFRSLENGPNFALAGARARIQDLLRDPLQTVQEQLSGISSLVMDFTAEEGA